MFEERRNKRRKRESMVSGLFSGDPDGKKGALEARLPNSTATLVKEVLNGNRNVGLTF